MCEASQMKSRGIINDLARLFMVGISVVCLNSTTSAQTEPNRYREQLEPLIKRVMRDAEMPGFAIAVVDDRRVVYAAGFGVRDTASKQPASARSLFHMASVTKLFVTTSIMQLQGQGKVDLNAPVVKYLPYFRLADERYQRITVRQMLNHTSGMPDVEHYEWDKPQYDVGALERYVKSLTNYSLISEPGTRMQYSNMAYEVLGDLIAKVSGMSFEDYVRRRIFEPLGMKSSTLMVKEADAGLLTSPHVLGASYEVEVSKSFLTTERIHRAGPSFPTCST